jgi:peptidoglycan hydrolase CwlO-like protein
MKNLARMYRTGGTPPAPPKSDETLNEEMMPGILNQPETEAEKKKREAEKKAAELAKKAEKSAPAIDPDQKKAKGGPIYSRGAKVSSASARADGIAQRGKTRGKIC